MTRFAALSGIQPDGLFGYCQPVGGSPENNINNRTTSDFCVGQFLLAASYVGRLAQGAAAAATAM